MAKERNPNVDFSRNPHAESRMPHTPDPLPHCQPSIPADISLGKYRWPDTDQGPDPASKMSRCFNMVLRDACPRAFPPLVLKPASNSISPNSIHAIFAPDSFARRSSVGYAARRVVIVVFAFLRRVCYNIKGIKEIRMRISWISSRIKKSTRRE